jgi:hypothetical protein
MVAILLVYFKALPGTVDAHDLVLFQAIRNLSNFGVTQIFGPSTCHSDDMAFICPVAFDAFSRYQSID